MSIAAQLLAFDLYIFLIFGAVVFKEKPIFVSILKREKVPRGWLVLLFVWRSQDRFHGFLLFLVFTARGLIENAEEEMMRAGMSTF